jgi:Urease, gamma subunit
MGQERASGPAGTRYKGAKPMLLRLHERERLVIDTAAKLAAERKDRARRLNLPEARG